MITVLRLPKGFDIDSFIAKAFAKEMGLPYYPLTKYPLLYEVYQKLKPVLPAYITYEKFRNWVGYSKKYHGLYHKKEFYIHPTSAAQVLAARYRKLILKELASAPASSRQDSQ